VRLNFAVVDGLIVMRTAAGATLARKAHDAIVAFEADDLDAVTSSGWSVVVTGRATRVTEPELIAPVSPRAPHAVGTRRTPPVRDDHDRGGGGLTVGGGLENHSGGNVTVGSNPTPSASSLEKQS
jgi:Pyridoxamine 5'-phosphate oxidase